jgi:hypothetical protein
MMFLETQRDAKAHYHKRSNTAPRTRKEVVGLTIACRMAQCGKPGLLGGSLIEAKKPGL